MEALLKKKEKTITHSISLTNFLLGEKWFLHLYDNIKMMLLKILSFQLYLSFIQMTLYDQFHFILLIFI